MAPARKWASDLPDHVWGLTQDGKFQGFAATDPRLRNVRPRNLRPRNLRLADPGLRVFGLRFHGFGA